MNPLNLAIGLICATVFAILLGATEPKDYVRAVLFIADEKPKLDGAYPVGFSTIELKLNSPNQTRPVDVWYPAEADALTLSAKLERFGRMVSRPFAPPIQPQASISKAEQKYPLVLYFPSWFATRQQSTFTPANLASHGFVVVAVDDIVHWQPLAGDEAKAQSAPMPASSVQDWDRFRPVAALRAEVSARLSTEIIEALASSERLGRSIDFEKIGAIGFSFGGATAAQLSRSEKRIKAVVNFDGSVYGDAERLGVDAPYLMFFSDFQYPSEYELTQADGPTQVDALLKKEAIAHQIAQSAKPDNWTYVVKHTVHEDFCDRMVKPPVESAFRERQLAGAKTWSELNTYLVAFFDRYLRQGNGALLGTAPFEEIRPFLETLAPPAQSSKNASPRNVF